MGRIGVDGGADFAAPGVGTERFGVFVLCEVDALDHDLGEIGEGARGFGRDVAADGGSEEASEGGVEIAGGEIASGKEMSEFAAELVGGVDAIAAARVIRTEQWIAGLARGAAAAAVGESEVAIGCGT